MMQARVREKEQVAEGIFAFTLEALAGGKFMGKLAGAHIDVHLPSGLVRQYSLTGIKRDVPHQLSIAVLREAEGRGGSRELCDEVSTGDLLNISQPRSNFELEHSRSQYRLLAGGIGITPLLHMAIELQELGKDFQLDICAKTMVHIPFKELLGSEEFAPHVQYHLSMETDSCRLDLPRYLEEVPGGAQIYACGPNSLLDQLKDLTADWGMGRVRTERFSAEIEELSEADSGEFTVKLARSGQEFTVPVDRSILDILNDLGISRDAACLEGVCGTCITDVVSGDIIHRDSCLYEEERAANSMMAICVSRGRPGETIVLDI